jgi:hypothetical protein
MMSILRGRSRPSTARLSLVDGADPGGTPPAGRAAPGAPRSGPKVRQPYERPLGVSAPAVDQVAAAARTVRRCRGRVRARTGRGAGEGCGGGRRNGDVHKASRRRFVRRRRGQGGAHLRRSGWRPHPLRRVFGRPFPYVHCGLLRRRCRRRAAPAKGLCIQRSWRRSVREKRRSHGQRKLGERACEAERRSRVGCEIDRHRPVTQGAGEESACLAVVYADADWLRARFDVIVGRSRKEPTAGPERSRPIGRRAGPAGRVLRQDRTLPSGRPVAACPARER